MPYKTANRRFCGVKFHLRTKTVKFVRVEFQLWFGLTAFVRHSRWSMVKDVLLWTLPLCGYFFSWPLTGEKSIKKGKIIFYLVHSQGLLQPCWLHFGTCFVHFVFPCGFLWSKLLRVESVFCLQSCRGLSRPQIVS